MNSAPAGPAEKQARLNETADKRARLDEASDKRARLDEMMKKIRSRYGEDSIRKG